MNLNGYIKNFGAQLGTLYDEGETEAMMLMLIENVLNRNRTQLSAESHLRFSESELSTIHSAIARLKNSEPLQYVLGKAWFCNMEFEVNNMVLIPRPETEEIVEWTVNELKKLDSISPLNLLDIGTGSGCIAIALKQFLPNCNVYATDISAGALSVAKNNAVKNTVAVNFFETDILHFENEKSVQNFGANFFDCIISNPPYISSHQFKDMEKNVLNYEPEMALFPSGNDDLIFYKAIIRFAKIFLKPKGRLFFEINTERGNAVKHLLSENNFASVILKCDISGNERMISAIKN